MMGISLRQSLMAMVMVVMAAGCSGHRLPRSIGLFSPTAPSGPQDPHQALSQFPPPPLQPLPQFPPGPPPQIIDQGPPPGPQVITLPSFPQTVLRTRVLPHHIPPKTYRVVKTVGLPYPVPHPVRNDVPVAIPKPYPVPVPVPSHEHYKQSAHADITQAVFRGSEESEGSSGYEDTGALLVPPVPSGGGIDDYSHGHGGGGPNAISAINDAFEHNDHGGASVDENAGAYSNVGATTAGEAYNNYVQQHGPGGRAAAYASGPGGDHYGSSSETRQTVKPEGGDRNEEVEREREDLKKRSELPYGGSRTQERTIVTIEKAVDAGSYVHTSYSGANGLHRR